MTRELHYKTVATTPLKNLTGLNDGKWYLEQTMRIIIKYDVDKQEIDLGSVQIFIAETRVFVLNGVKEYGPISSTIDATELLAHNLVEYIENINWEAIHQDTKLDYKN